MLVQVAMIQIMGIVNLTPDSFWEASRADAATALEKIESMLAEGADIIDLGAVSTRPGADPVDVEAEWARLEPVLRQLPQDVILSVDTTSAQIVSRVNSLLQRPFIVNDISAGEDDPQMLDTVAALGLRYVAMHKRGNPQTMDALTGYHSGVVKELISYFEEFAQRAEVSGLKDWIIDPGLGFAKTEQQNWEILEKLSELQSLDRPILIGAADKRFTHGNNARAHELAILGGADILRVHNVKETKLQAQSLLQK